MSEQEIKKQIYVDFKKDADVELSAAQCAQYCKRVGLKFHEGLEKRVIQFRFTDASVDWHKEVVVPKGGDLSFFKKKPVILFMHDAWSFPIGRSIKTWYDKEKDAILGWVLFFDDEMDRTGFSEDVYRMVDAGGLDSGSIGFRALWKDQRKPSPEEQEKYGKDVKWIYDKWILMEYSIVTIGANMNAGKEPIKMEVRENTLESLLKDGIDLMKGEGEKYFVKSVGSKTEHTDNDELPGPIFILSESDERVTIDVRIDDGDGVAEIEKKVSWVKQLTEVKSAKSVNITLTKDLKQNNLTKHIEEIKQAISDLRETAERIETLAQFEDSPVQTDSGDDEADSKLYDLLENANKTIRKE
jgi:phage head maturation protease